MFIRYAQIFVLLSVSVVRCPATSAAANKPDAPKQATITKDSLIPSFSEQDKYESKYKAYGPEYFTRKLDPLKATKETISFNDKKVEAQIVIDPSEYSDKKTIVFVIIDNKVFCTEKTYVTGYKGQRTPSYEAICTKEYMAQVKAENLKKTAANLLKVQEWFSNPNPTFKIYDKDGNVLTPSIKNDIVTLKPGITLNANQFFRLMTAYDSWIKKTEDTANNGQNIIDFPRINLVRQNSSYSKVWFKLV